MITESANDTHADESEPLSAVFRQMDFGYVKTVVSRALELRSKASESVRSSLGSSIRKSVRLDGFKDASRALPQQLTEPVMWEILEEGDDRLAGAILRAWAESHAGLHDLAVEHLGGLGIPAEYPDFKGSRFKSEWLRDEWLSECEAVADGRDDLDFDDVALMLCYVSGRIPEPSYDEEPEVESPLFLKWLDELNELPMDAPEWAEIPELLEALSRMTTDKIVARLRAKAEELEQKVSHTMEGFEAELRYLDLDIGSWHEDAVARVTAVPMALDLIEELHDRLAEYRLVQPQGATRSEEAARSDARRECEEAIIDIAARWDLLMEEHELPGDEQQEAGYDARESGADGDNSGRDGEAQTVGETAEQPSLEHRAGESDAAEIDEEYLSLKSELDRLKQDSDSFRSENSRLQQENTGLQLDKTLLDKENSELRNDLSQSRETEESWRRAYIAVSANQASAERDDSPELGRVNDALALAERAFPDQLLFALNSKSAKDSPFQKPGEVFDALAWLATEYHRLRMNPGASPDFDKLVKEACPGWSYRPDQAEVTKDQFAQWYTTAVDGKTYELYSHVGKGNSFDPQNTIRIAFAWDDDLRVVVVGYIGLHQKTRRS